MKQVYCTVCGTANIKDSVFCQECGTIIPSARKMVMELPDHVTDNTISKFKEERFRDDNWYMPMFTAPKNMDDLMKMNYPWMEPTFQSEDGILTTVTSKPSAQRKATKTKPLFLKPKPVEPANTITIGGDDMSLPLNIFILLFGGFLIFNIVWMVVG